MHLFIRLIGNCVFHYRDLIAILSGITDSRLQTSVCNESHDDELMDAVLLQLQIQICVGEATGTPVLWVHNLTRLRFELAADLAASRAVFEGLSQPRCFLDGCNVFPGLVVAWTVAMMQRIEHAKFSLPRFIAALIRFCA